jgi:hypothetical protein
MWALVMKWLRHGGKQGFVGRQAIGVLLLGVFLSVLAMASSQVLHHALHANAAKSDHHCAVTLLASGQVEASSGAVVASAAPAFVILFVVPDHFFESGVTFNLPLSRGPPALLSYLDTGLFTAGPRH